MKSKKKGKKPDREIPTTSSAKPEPSPAKSKELGAVDGKVWVQFAGSEKQVIHPDDGREYPPGTMLSWDVKVGDRKEMRWTVTGGGWPFEDD